MKGDLNRMHNPQMGVEKLHATRKLFQPTLSHRSIALCSLSYASACVLSSMSFPSSTSLLLTIDSILPRESSVDGVKQR